MPHRDVRRRSGLEKCLGLLKEVEVTTSSREEREQKTDLLEKGSGS